MARRGWAARFLAQAMFLAQPIARRVQFKSAHPILGMAASEMARMLPRRRNGACPVFGGIGKLWVLPAWKPGF